MDLDACEHGIIALCCVYDFTDGVFEVFLDHLAGYLRKLKQTRDIAIGYFLDEPPFNETLLDILLIDLDMELAGVEFIEKQAERAAGAGFFLDPPAFAEAGLAVFVDRRYGGLHRRHSALCPPPGGHGALRPSALFCLR